jgi:hypothetical protein
MGRQKRKREVREVSFVTQNHGDKQTILHPPPAGRLCDDTNNINATIIGGGEG